MADAIIQSVGFDTVQQILGTFDCAGSGSFTDQQSTELTLKTIDLSSILPSGGLIRIKGSVRYKGTLTCTSYHASFISRFYIYIGSDGYVASTEGPSVSSGSTSFDITLDIDYYALCVNGVLLVFDTDNSNSSYYAGSTIRITAYGGNGSTRGSMSATSSGTINVYAVN